MRLVNSDLPRTDDRPTSAWRTCGCHVLHVSIMQVPSSQRRVFPVLLPLALALLGLLACSASAPPDTARPRPESDHPYAHPTTLLQPVLFARDAVSTPAPEFATSFAPDGHTAYFNRASPDRAKLRIMRSRFHAGTWQSAEPLPFSDGTHRDVDPFVTADGSRLYFSADRPIAGGTTDDDVGFDTFYVERTDSGWSAPVRAPAPLSSPDNDIFVSLTRAGTVYLSSGDADGNWHLYRIPAGAKTRERIAIAMPDAAGTGAKNSALSNPCIGPDERFLVFSSAQHGGQGGSDLFVAYRRADGTWSPAQNLGPAINSPFADFAPNVSPDGRYLFFTSERPGVVPTPGGDARPPGDIYQVALLALPGWRESIGPGQPGDPS